MEELTKQTQALNDKMQLMMEQIVLSNKSRFGRSSEKMTDPGQIRFMEVDGKIIFFNEAEAVCDLTALEPDDLELRASKRKNRQEELGNDRYRQWSHQFCDHLQHSRNSEGKPAETI